MPIQVPGSWWGVMLVALAAACAPDTDRPDDDEPGEPACVTDDAFFADTIEPILQSDCAACHRPDGAAALTRLHVVPASEADHTVRNQAAVAELIDTTWEGHPLLLAKPGALTPHGGGERLIGERRALFEELVHRHHAPGACADPGPPDDVCATRPFDPGEAGLRRLTETQHRNTVQALFGELTLPGQYPITQVSGGAYRSWASQNPVSAAVVEASMLEAEGIAAQVQGDLARTGCDLSADDEQVDACLEAWILDRGARAFRRPLTTDEQGILLGVWDARTDRADGVGMAVEALLQAPQFLYLDASPPAGSAGTVVPLDDFARAERLSYFLWDGPPDDTLWAAAEAGALSTPAQVEAQARRMVADPRVEAAVVGFHLDWADTSRLLEVNKDTDVYPDFDPELVASMRTELALFFTREVWASGEFDTLLTSTATWSDARTDAIYGIDSGSEGPGDFRRVELDPSTRPGVLTRSGFLTGHAYAASSSPIRRGMWVLDKLLCEHMEVPPGVDATLNEEPGDEALTLRERLEKHRADPACSGCHQRIDPVGFSLEHYGGLGEWRDTYADGNAIHSAGTLAQPDGSFDSAAGLLDTLRSTDRVRDCYAGQWLSYAVGRDLDEEDACSLRDVRARFAEADGDLVELLVAVATAEAFLLTRITEEEG